MQTSGIITFPLLESTVLALFSLHRGTQLIPHIEGSVSMAGAPTVGPALDGAPTVGPALNSCSSFPVYPSLHSTSWQTLNPRFGYLNYFTRNERHTCVFKYECLQFFRRNFA